MTGPVHYQLPFGLLGDLFAGHVVERRVATIFAYRRLILEELFGHAGQEDETDAT